MSPAPPQLHVTPAGEARPALAAALLLAITLLAWLPALRNGFIWDDDQPCRGALRLYPQAR